MAEFEVKGVTYRCGKMVGLTQIHVLRRAAPIIKPLFSVIGRQMTPADATQVIDGLSELEDEKLNYILDKTHAVVQRKQDETRWAPIKSSDGRMFMFDDIRDDGLLMIAISTNVLFHNYYPLFQDAPSLFSDGAAFLR